MIMQGIPEDSDILALLHGLLNKADIPLKAVAVAKVANILLETVGLNFVFDPDLHEAIHAAIACSEMCHGQFEFGDNLQMLIFILSQIKSRLAQCAEFISFSLNRGNMSDDELRYMEHVDLFCKETISKIAEGLDSWEKEIEFLVVKMPG